VNPALLFRPLKICRIAGVDIFLHWTMWLFPVFILARGFVLYSSDETLMQTLLVLGVYVCLFLHEVGHILAARALRLALRDITLFPIGGSDRLAEISDRPWKEIRFAAVGPLVHVVIAGLIAFVFLAAGLRLSPRLDAPLPYLETFFIRLFWLNVLLGIGQIIPAFPMDGGRLFRGALALSARRLRATEVSALLGSFVALAFIVCGMVWLSLVWWLIVLGIIIHVGSQQELMRVRYFAYLQDPTTQISGRAPTLVNIDQVLEDDKRRVEPHFTGMTWDPKHRLWIAWNDGEPVSANALVGE
jgi:Zn-dependent protease